MGKMGRPKKYKSKRVSIYIQLFQDTIDFFDDKAREINETSIEKITRTELIQSSLIQADMDLAIRTAQDLGAMRKQVGFLTLQNKQLSNKTKEYIDALNNRIDRNFAIYSELPEPDSLMVKAMDKVKDMFTKVWKQGKASNWTKGHTEKDLIAIWSNMVYEDFRLLALKENKNIIKENLAKKVITKLLLEQVYGTQAKITRFGENGK